MTFVLSKLKSNIHHMEYREFRPSPALQDCIDCFWVHDGVLPENEIYRCVPSGTASIIIGTTDGEEWVQRGETWERMPWACVTGIWTEPAVLRSARRIRWFGIQFKLEAFVEMFHQPLRELENATLDVRSVLGQEADELAHRIAEAADTAERIAIAETYFSRKTNQYSLRDAYANHAIKLIRQHGGQVSTEELGKKVFVSERQLQRTFREYFGVTPKTYGRLVRFTKAGYLLKSTTNINWLDITYRCGYADQAHFIRDFREFTGTNPTAFITDPAALMTLSTRLAG